LYDLQEVKNSQSFIANVSFCYRDLFLQSLGRLKAELTHKDNLPL